MEIYACNFNSDANIEGDCLFFDCAQICDGSSYVDDCDVCDDDPSNDNGCFGCMDLWALNYDPNSTINDDSCEYPSIGDISMDGFINVNDIVLLVGIVLDGEYYIDYMDINQDFYLNIIDIVILVDIILNPEYLGCTYAWASNYNPDAIYNDGSCEYITVMDIDGNLYNAVIIGEQVWMAENLKVANFRNGDPIPTGFSDNEWSNLSIGAYSIYENNPIYFNIYGYLYNWFAVDDDRSICPEGWHVPTDGEWLELSSYIGAGNETGGILKSTGTVEEGNGLWHEPNAGATNEYNFTAFPGGWRDHNDNFDENSNNNFYGFGYHGKFWTSSINDGDRAWSRNLRYHNPNLWRNGYDTQKYGYSVRCVKDSQ